LAVLKGRSGSGKTTLLNCLGGLDRPTEGEVLFDGRSLSTMNEAELTLLRRHRVGYVFQSFALMPLMSAIENVEQPLRIMGLPVKERERRARECLEVVGLTKWADHRPFELSGGQQQRVAVARALAVKPDLILADEPTGELDSRTGIQIIALFRRLVAEHGVCVCLTTHDPAVMELADVTYELADGAVQDVVTRAAEGVRA
jgi:ABC-type lipoprotein export system ATPase subunit